MNADQHTLMAKKKKEMGTILFEEAQQKRRAYSRWYLRNNPERASLGIWTTRG